MSTPPYLGKNYIGHPTVQAGTKLRCIKAEGLPQGYLFGKHDEVMADVHNLNFFRYHTPGNFEVVSQPKRQSSKKV